ncbi:hypothetical protein C8A00DRAFT_16798 [Chaetomidium leptoderma]|uniref:C2H2-type domain-containing protein n=1 Tax=Chaetomidium leptoderma TaxID=669021 RepID=A0AAN6ZUX2_9PEZI|nr:hypothetical protein C8A00DRAFT_16798 [Chaetomidium leptoderma]
MGLTTILRGFKIPVTLLDRFLETNGIKPTFGYPPIYDCLPLPGSDHPPLDPESAFLRNRLGGDTKTRIFVPNRQGVARSTHAYVAYAYVMVLGQRQIKFAAELPDRPPAEFGELRNEILGFAKEEEQGLLKVAGMQPDEEGEDPASLLFVVVTDDREYPYHGPFMRESDLRCDDCPTVFESWIDLQTHRRDVHGVEFKNVLPDDL